MGNEIYDLIKAERRKRGLPNIFWSEEMAAFARNQASNCAGAGKLFHSDRHTLQGGENLWGGWGDPNPIDAVNAWLHSAGHKENLLSPRIKKAGVATVYGGNGFTCVAFASSYRRPSYPDCPSYVPYLKVKLVVESLLRRVPMRDPVLKFMAVVLAVLGAHGLYVRFIGLEAAIYGGDRSSLTLEVPEFFREVIHRSTITIGGFQSWLMPVVMLIVAVVLWYYPGWVRMWIKRILQIR